MTQRVRAVLLLVAVSCSLLGQAPRAEKDEHLLDGDFTIVRTVAALPDVVKSALTEGPKGDLNMADPGHWFNAGDVGRPGRQLIFAGISGDRGFIYFKQGGIGTQIRVVVFQIVQSSRPPNAAPVWSGAEVEGPVHDLSELRSKLAAGSFYHDQHSHW